jgi:hypothetical protein
MAKSKVMRNTRGISPDDVYMPPKVPEFLPITHWCATLCPVLRNHRHAVSQLWGALVRRLHTADGGLAVSLFAAFITHCLVSSKRWVHPRLLGVLHMFGIGLYAALRLM